MKRPPYLKKGDLVLLIASARAKSETEISGAIDVLTGWGLKVECGKNIYKKEHQFAGSDSERAEDLQWAVSHPDAKAVIFTGGGYGTIRIIDAVNFKALRKFPKWFVGYSDVTVLHNRMHQLNMCSVHGTMAFQFLKNKNATTSLKNLLFGKKVSYPVKPHALNRAGTAEAELTGGNLSILFAVSGSVDDVDPKNKLLFIEDLDEYLYHIDRMMMQLKRSGKLKNLKGLIVGGMSDMKDNTVPFGKTAEEIILDAVKEYNYPVCFNFPAGHISENHALCLGRKAKLSITKNKVSLVYSEK